MLNNRSGWPAAANAILKFKMPLLESTDRYYESATDRLRKLGTFAEHFVVWLRKFARAIVQYWDTAGYKRSRAQSGTSIEEWGTRWAPPGQHLRVPARSGWREHLAARSDR